jgi:hypothetical protein
MNHKCRSRQALKAARHGSDILPLGLISDTLTQDGHGDRVLPNRSRPVGVFFGITLALLAIIAIGFGLKPQRQPLVSWKVTATLAIGLVLESLLLSASQWKESNMAEDKLQLQRLELKYVISESVAVGIRDFVSSILEIDEFGATRPNLSYPVHSLYLDSNDLRLYWETINGTKNRFKLRLRFYDNRPEAPVYFEIKRRMNNCIMKQRGGVRRDSVGWLEIGRAHVW